MILGLGVDLLENGRVEQELARGQWLADKGIFTPAEISYCSCAGSPALCYAACFAAKEAMLKALAVEPGDLAMFREVELGPGIGSDHTIILHDRLKTESEQLGVRHIRLSIAHSGNHTAAIVILEA